MQLIRTEVMEGDIGNRGEANGMTVVFTGDGGERVTVEIAETEAGSLTRENATQKAQVILLQLASFDMAEGSTKGEASGEEVSPAVKSVRQERADREQHGGNALEEGIEDTFPASDPVSAVYTSTPGSS